MRSIWIFLLVAFSFSGNGALHAQRVQDWLILGEESMRANDPYGALRYFSEVMYIDSSRALHNYKYAEALRLNHQYEKAAFYYLKVYRRDLGVVFPEGPAWLASMQKQSGDFAEAKKTWRKVRDQHKSVPESYWFRKANQEIRACDLAQEWSAQTAPFTLQEPPDFVNSGDSEFAGIFQDDGKLVISSLRGTYDEKGRVRGDASAYKVRIYEANLEAQTLNQKSFFPDSIAAEANYAADSAETKIAFSTQDEAGKTAIYILHPAHSGENPEKFLPQSGDTAYYSHPAFGILDGEEVLFFTSDRPGGYGGMDIWFIFLAEKNATPVNAGELINSPGNEITPFYRKSEKALYFASDWHFGFGGYDIFQSGYDGDRFIYPQNMKLPFNNPSNDLYYSFNERIGKGAITSNRNNVRLTETETCCNDIWLFEEEQIQRTDTLPEIVTLEDLNRYLPVKLYFHNDEPDPRTTAERTSKNYLDTYYSFTALLPEYSDQYKKGLQAPEEEEAEEAMDQFFISEVDQGVEDLKLFARLLAFELKEGQRIDVTVKGFASPLAKTDYNVKLTSRRISSLINYLKSYESGSLLPYLDGTAENGGRLLITEVAFGEYAAEDLISDNPNDRVNAIYSIAAARERKIEIVSVQRLAEDSTIADVRFESEIIDFGAVELNDTLSFSFYFSVSGNTPLIIDSLKFDARFLNVSQNDTRIESGSKSAFTGNIFTGSNPGKRKYTLLLYGNLPKGYKELNITFETE